MKKIPLLFSTKLWMESIPDWCHGLDAETRCRYGISLVAIAGTRRYGGVCMVIVILI